MKLVNVLSKGNPVEIRSLDLRAIIDASRLLHRYPLRIVGIILLFIVMAEALMFVPFIGFLAKIVVAGFLAAQILAVLCDAAAGTPPNPLALFRTSRFRMTEIISLTLASLLPFAVGIAFLYMSEGAPAIKYFFGNIRKDKAPSTELFFQFKLVMYFVNSFVFFVPAAIVLSRGRTWELWQINYQVIRRNGLLLAIIFLESVGFELLLGWFTQHRRMLPLLPVFFLANIAFIFAFTYSSATRILVGSTPAHEV